MLRAIDADQLLTTARLFKPHWVRCARDYQAVAQAC